ncbi:hypothetical protein MCOR02_005134 [Pyricularia oryzae]|uniref:Sodium:neurotransmitter symporter family protein n=1 Tax=Pyricularia oryzae TaxID=318829 RepID=A0A4P7MSZ6_PYROR|nr:hypothetical protein MCOR02_005134 [Pyricularia oryzae]QBZ53397.1 hypothetical protein PoMZ_09075 [Pyricularia oryzae]
MGMLRKVGHWFAPPADKADDGRDVWPSRAAFLLASMGGCAGMGNLLRYPSTVYNNYGLQWFIPYLMCIFLIAIPVLTLEISIGQAYRGGSVVAFNNINHRLKGTGFSLLYIGFIVGPYFVVNLAWIMTYFRYSFHSPLPWADDPSGFFDRVVANPEPVAGSLNGDGTAIESYTRYAAMGMVGETVGWCAFTWFLVWLCIFRGVGLTGRVVYWTMGLPIVMTIILIGRSVSLENAGEGVKLYFATWRGEQLARGSVWQTACGQVFFSTGVGFGYFTSYASYNRKHSNAVMDSFLIILSNMVFECTAAFAVFGVVGFLRMFPEPGAAPIGGFTIGFLTLPAAVEQMPGANFWAIALFFTLMVLGFSSAFAMLDAVVTLVMDSGVKLPRPAVVSSLTLLSFLLSLPYCTEFGYYLLDGVDRWISDVALVFVVFAECTTSTSLYRWRDVAGQVGPRSFCLYNVGYFGGLVSGVAAGIASRAEIGAGVGFGVYIIFAAASVFMGKVPDAPVPTKFGGNVFLQRFYYVAFYSGHQLTKDLNVIVAQGNNWSIPVFWAPMLRYLSGPILAIVYGFSYPTFHEKKVDPLHIFGFFTGHVVLALALLGLVAPRWFDVLIPPHRRDEGRHPYAPRLTMDPDAPARDRTLEGMDDGTGRHRAAELRGDDDAVAEMQAAKEGRGNAALGTTGNRATDMDVVASSSSGESPREINKQI